MTYVARAPRRPFVAVAVGWALLAVLPWVEPMGIGERVFFAAFALLLLALTANLLVARAKVDETGVELRAIRRRNRLRAPLDAVVTYRPDKEGRWWVETAERRVPLPVREPWAVHAALAALAPRVLDAKRFRPKSAPPEAEFRGLWLCDVDRLTSETLGRAVAVLALVALTRRIGGAYGILLAPLFFGLFELGGRLDVTREGLVRRGPFHRRTILWSEAVAIFCERGAVSRSFVVTSRETAIEIPDHLARDPDLMRKVFLSLPPGVLCVGFDETTFRGYRRRKKAASPEPAGDLMPALTTFRARSVS